MKNVFTFWKIFRAIWPEVKALIHHIQNMLPKDEHVPAAKHILKEGQHMVNGDNHTILVNTWNHEREKQLQDFDLENY